MTHRQLPQVVDAVRVVHYPVLRVQGVDVAVEGLAEVVEAVQRVQDVEAGDVAAVVRVPVGGYVVVVGRGAVGGLRFGVGEEEVAVAR